MVHRDAGDAEQQRGGRKGPDGAAEGGFQPVTRFGALEAAVERGGKHAVHQQFGKQQRGLIDDPPAGEEEHSRQRQRDEREREFVGAAQGLGHVAEA